VGHLRQFVANVDNDRASRCSTWTVSTRSPATTYSVDRRWIGVAVYSMLRDGRIRAVGCDHGSHDGDCVVEEAR
jgi:hypothetical protein